MTRRLRGFVLALVAAIALAPRLAADAVPQSLPFAQDWTNTGLITANDLWTGVPGIEGFRGDNLTAVTGADPQTLLAGDDPGVLDVNANQTNPDTFTTGGVTEFEIANPAVAVSGSGTADAPYVRFYLDTTGAAGVTVRYLLRDLDGSTDDAVQQVALHYRLGASGTFTNVPAAYVADATTGPSQATLTTPVCVVLPVEAENQPLVEVRVMTTNAVGNDEWVAVDDFQADTAGCGTGAPTLSIGDVSHSEGDSGFTDFTFTISVSGTPAGTVTFDATVNDGTATVADNDYVDQDAVPLSIVPPATSVTFTVQVVGDAISEPNETFSVTLANVVNADPGDTTGTGTILNDDVVITPVHDIQGAGAASPLVGTVVTTRGIVTGVKSNGFFLQAPDAQADADPATSEGILVFTSGAPAVAVGDDARVTGTVSEFVPASDPFQPPLTELGNPSLAVAVLSSGNPLPAAVPLTTLVPDPAGAFDQLERLEGMRVATAGLRVVGPTLGSVNEPNATATTNGVLYGVVNGTPRPYREAGVQLPDPLPAGSPPDVPRWDTNPETLRIDSDAAGHAALDADAGALLGGVAGPLDYGFRHYTIDLEAGAVVISAASQDRVPTPVAPPAAGEFTVASYNLQRFFDDVDDPAIGEPVLTAAAFARRLAKASAGIRDYLVFPDVVGVAECENLSTLEALAARISADALAAGQADPLYEAYLLEGHDIGGIDVGFLVKTAPVSGSVPRVEALAVAQEGYDTLFVNPDQSSEFLNDRPSLRLEARVAFATGDSFPVTVLVNHLRSLSGVNSESAGSNGWATVGERVRAKRLQQATELAGIVQARQVAGPAEWMVLVGDFNAFEFNDGFVDSIGTLTGAPAPDDQTVVPGDGADLVEPNLVRLAPEGSYSYVFDGSAQSLDHALADAALAAAAPGARMEEAHVNADFAEVVRNDDGTVARLSDHDPLVTYFRPAAIDPDALFRGDFETGDTRWWTVAVP